MTSTAAAQTSALVQVESGLNPSLPGDAVTFTATVNGTSPTGTIAFKRDGAVIGSCGAVPLSSSSARCTVVFETPGTRSIVAEYSGDAANTATAGMLSGGQVVSSEWPMLIVDKVSTGFVVGPGIGCGEDCAEYYPPGSTVTLFANPSGQSGFRKWSGCDSVNGNECTMYIQTDRVVTVTFASTVAAPYDFNADGKPDILWSNTGSGATQIWYMDGKNIMSNGALATVDPAWRIQGVGDFNGDGHSDVVWRNGAGASYVWYLVNGVFQSDAFLFNLPPEWVIQGVADFNTDGKPDFLMRNVNSGNAFVWFFNNNVAIGDQFFFNIDPSWKVEGVADLSADGQPDLLFRNINSGVAFAWNSQFSNGSLSLASSSPPMFSIDPAWEVMQVSDWNGDGKPDLLFRNRESTTVLVWYMDGTTLTTSEFITQNDPAWVIVPRS